MQIRINAISITAPPEHSNPVLVWDKDGEWEEAAFRNGKWQPKSGAVEHLIWWAELPVLLPGGAFYFESERICNESA